MKVFRISKQKWTDDLSGIGAKLTGGRWNPKGYSVLYCASTSSLAILEKLVNIDYDLLPSDLFITELDLPDSSIKSIEVSDLPKNWNAYPSPDKLKLIGKNWIDNNESFLLKVPSAVNPSEANYLVNVKHELMQGVKIIKSYPVKIDERLKR